MLDTDVVIEVDKGRLELPDATCYISALTLYEYIRGKRDYRRAKELAEQVYYVLPVSNKVLLLASGIWRKLKTAGMLVDDRDLLIGATAIAHELPLYTLNRRHYERLLEYGLQLWPQTPRGQAKPSSKPT